MSKWKDELDADGVVFTRARWIVISTLRASGPWVDCIVVDLAALAKCLQRRYRLKFDGQRFADSRELDAAQKARVPFGMFGVELRKRLRDAT